jgi:hypothetical protein
LRLGYLHSQVLKNCPGPSFRNSMVGMSGDGYMWFTQDYIAQFFCKNPKHVYFGLLAHVLWHPLLKTKSHVFKPPIFSFLK